MNEFRLFSLIFSYPDETTLKEISKLKEVEELSDYREKIEEFLKIPVQEVQPEYTRLFINSYPELLCPPYESFYRDGSVYGETSIEVREIYQKQGLEYKATGEPPDSVSAELDFLAITAHPGFLSRFGKWISSFTERVKRHSKIYGVWAVDLENFLKTQTEQARSGLEF